MGNVKGGFLMFGGRRFVWISIAFLVLGILRFLFGSGVLG